MEARKKSRILFVDDELDILAVVKKGLERYGYRIDTVSVLELVLRAYQPGRYDLLIIDYKMPLINGFELYKKIRELDNHVMVCFLTAFESKVQEYKKVFPPQSGTSFVIKPISIVALEAKLTQLLMN